MIIQWDQDSEDLDYFSCSIFKDLEFPKFEVSLQLHVEHHYAIYNIQYCISDNWVDKTYYSYKIHNDKLRGLKDNERRVFLLEECSKFVTLWMKENLLIKE